MPSPLASCRVAVVADLVDLGLGQPAVAVGVDALEHLHRRDRELSLVEEAPAAVAVAGVAHARQHGPAKGCRDRDGGQCLRLHRSSPVSVRPSGIDG